MFTQDELKLMYAPGMEQFPLVKAAGNMWRQYCKACSHSGRANPKNALKMAINMYKNKPEFRAKCAEVLKLPAYIAGSIIS